MRSVLSLMLLCSLYLMLPACSQPRGEPDPKAGSVLGMPVNVGVAITFGWTYPENVANLAAFQLIRCGPIPTTQAACSGGDGLPFTFPPSARQGTDPTPIAGARYCWTVRGMATQGQHSEQSNQLCETMPSVIMVLPVPQDFRKVTP